MISKKRFAVIAALRQTLPPELRLKIYEYLQYPGAYKRHWKKKFTKVLTCRGCKTVDMCVLSSQRRKIQRSRGPARAGSTT